MNCPNCESITKKNGKDRKGTQKFRCLNCGKVFTAAEKLEGKRLSADKIELCIKLLVEGNSVRSTERITGVHRDTILRLLESVGTRCMAIQETLIRGLHVKDLQLDEIWAFIGAKQKTVNQREVYDEKVGSSYTFTCIDSDSKLIVAWHLGKRSLQDTEIFLDKVYHAVDNGTENRYQVSTDAFQGYAHSVNEILGARADYGQIIKLYGKPNPNEVRYSAADCIGIKKRVVCGNPIKEKISTSFVERSNLTMRMAIRRFTRLTNAFSKKWENHNYALALHFAYYNFCRGHKTLNGATPAMAAGIAKTFWTLKDLIGIEGGEKIKAASNSN